MKNFTNGDCVIIHPLYDTPELKRSGEHLGLMELSGPKRLILSLLQWHMIIMAIMVTYHIADLAKFIHH